MSTCPWRWRAGFRVRLRHSELCSPKQSPCSLSSLLFYLAAASPLRSAAQHKCFVKLLMNQDRQIVWGNRFFPCLEKKSFDPSGKMWTNGIFLFQPEHLFSLLLHGAREGSCLPTAPCVLCGTACPGQQSPWSTSSSICSTPAHFTAILAQINFPAGIWVCVEGEQSGEG